MKRLDIDRNLLSPGMKQYMDIKDNYVDELLFFRLGDFYELFFEDGIIASRECELTLTGKNGGLDERIPMCGVPFHSAEPYIEKLLERGYKVAVCEQLGDPKTSKGVVERGVVAVYSRGSITDFSILKGYDNNFIASVLDYKSKYVITYSDISTGLLCVTECSKDISKLYSLISKYGFLEVVINDDKILYDELNRYNLNISICNDYLDSDSRYDSLIDSINNIEYESGVRHLLYYLVVKGLKDLSFIKSIDIIDSSDCLEMDIHTIRNLELVETLRLKERVNSLVWLLDKCKTSMGSRLLKSYILRPLVDIDLINSRYDKVDKLSDEFIILDELRNNLYEVYDIERLCGKVSCGNLNGRDLIQLKNSIEVLPKIEEYIKELGFDYKLVDVRDLYELLSNAIYDNPPVGIKEGYLIKEGYNKELDELKFIRSNGKDFIANLELEERERTGIKNLKVGFNKVFGYYIEVSKGSCNLVKDEFGYERRQTLSNCERFISPLLKEKEALVLNAEDKIVSLEYELFLTIKEIVKNRISDLLSNSDVLKELDVLCSFAICSSEYNLIRPSLNTSNNLRIVEGRHPVVERLSKVEYIANDCVMPSDTSTFLITGPNMSGKSTYMRQLGIIVIMAQIGCFVPCEEADLPIFDKIFTRIGASDDLVSGESTFMVEMLEANNALLNATENSLILFDELGRGTATYDGMSLAQAILEYINSRIKCKTLFSTHYHELTALDSSIPSLNNVHVHAVEENNEVIFLHKVLPGAVDKSYGIHVAKLAKMPSSLLKRASEILDGYESNSTTRDNSSSRESYEQMSLVFDKVDNKVLDKLDSININNITPIEALNLLNELKDMSDD